MAFNPHKWIAKAIGKDETRPALHGIYHAEDGRIVVTDGHRMHILARGSDRSGKLREKLGNELFETFPDFTKISDKPRPYRLTVRSVDMFRAAEVFKTAAKRLGKSVLYPDRVDIEYDNKNRILHMIGRTALEGLRYDLPVGTVLDYEEGFESICICARYLFDAVNGPWREEAVLRLTQERVSPVMLGIEYDACTAFIAKFRD